MFFKHLEFLCLFCKLNHGNSSFFLLSEEKKSFKYKESTGKYLFLLVQFGDELCKTQDLKS